MPSPRPGTKPRVFSGRIDGGARGNPGPAGIGVLLEDAGDLPHLLLYPLRQALVHTAVLEVLLDADAPDLHFLLELAAQIASCDYENHRND